MLTKRDTFLTRSEFIQLVYGACGELNNFHPLRIPKPAICRPQQLWTGKQVTTTVLKQITVGQPTLNLNSKSRIPASMWGKDSEESTVVFSGSELRKEVK